MKKLVVMILAAVATMVVMADFVKPPAACVRGLKATRGKPIKTGIVFVDGKFIKPPYVVERYGNVMRINGQQVTNPLIAWDEFLKTQEGAKVTSSSTEVGGGEAAAADDVPAEDPADDLFASDDDDPLADLFGDEPKPKKTAAKKPAPKKKAAAPRVVTKTTVEFTGTFEPNPKTDAMVAKLNKYRTNISQTLVKNGFLIFSSEHSNTSGAEKQMSAILHKLPECMRDARSAEDLEAMARSKGLSFLPFWFYEGAFRNRTSYIDIVNQCKKYDDDKQFSSYGK